MPWKNAQWDTQYHNCGYRVWIRNFFGGSVSVFDRLLCWMVWGTSVCLLKYRSQFCLQFLAVLDRFIEFPVQGQLSILTYPQKYDLVSSLYRRYHFDQYVEKYQEIADLISQNSVYSGHFDEIIQTDFQNDSRYTTQIDHTFLQHINRWRLEIGEHLYERFFRFYVWGFRQEKPRKSFPVYLARSS